MIKRKESFIPGGKLVQDDYVSSDEEPEKLGSVIQKQQTKSVNRGFTRNFTKKQTVKKGAVLYDASESDGYDNEDDYYDEEEPPLSPTTLSSATREEQKVS